VPADQLGERVGVTCDVGREQGAVVVDVVARCHP